MSFNSKSLPAATPEESARIEACKRGRCLACLLQDNVSEDEEYHHFKSGNVRIGHRFGVCLCMWHHRGLPRHGCTHEFMREAYGPSLAEGSKTFHARYGDDAFLLQMQDVLIGWPQTKFPARRIRAKSSCRSPSKIFKAPR